MRAVQRDPPTSSAGQDRRQADTTPILDGKFETISVKDFIKRGRAMATNPNQVDGGNQDGVAMADVVIVSNDALEGGDNHGDQVSQGNQGNQGKVGEVEEKAGEIVAGLADGTTDEDWLITLFKSFPHNPWISSI
eukprot:SAG22_NODE_6319_length_870_cov_14.214008_1_plen_135_part_00